MIVARSDRGEREAQAGSPQRVELAVAEADRDGVPTREDGHREERGERGAFVAAVHTPTLRAGARAQGRAEARPPNRDGEGSAK